MRSRAKRRKPNPMRTISDAGGARGVYALVGAEETWQPMMRAQLDDGLGRSTPRNHDPY